MPRLGKNGGMPNLPPNLVPPDHAVAVSKQLKLTTRTAQEEHGGSGGVQTEVLGIGWRSDHERLYYLVFDRTNHEVFWVDPEYVESLTG
jgi:hypothetical protein